LGGLARGLVTALVMLVVAILSFLVTVFIVQVGAGLGGYTPDGNFVVLSGAIIATGAIVAGASSMASLGGRHESDGKNNPGRWAPKAFSWGRVPGPMQLFLDSADMSEIKRADDWGVIDGITTNPSLAAEQDHPFDKLVAEICDLVEGPVSAEVVATEYDQIMQEARQLDDISEHIVVKVPLIKQGLKAVDELADEGIETNVTLNFQANQGLLAMKAGATYLSPFIGRLDDRGQQGLQLVEQLTQIKHNYGFETDILAASIRHPDHVLQCSLIGADVATLPFEVLESLYDHPLTDSGLAGFLEDWEESGLEI
jgi:transaldolase